METLKRSSNSETKPSNGLAEEEKDRLRAVQQGFRGEAWASLVVELKRLYLKRLMVLASANSKDGIRFIQGQLDIIDHLTGGPFEAEVLAPLFEQTNHWNDYMSADPGDKFDA